MATRTIANGGGNWSANATWVEGVAPTASDDVVATATSGQVTVNAGTCVCKTADFTGYLNTLTFTAAQTLTCSGSFKLVAGMTVAGTGKLVVNAAATITSASITFPGALSLGVAGTITLGDNWRVTGAVVINVNATILNGNTLRCDGSFTHNSTCSGTTTIQLGGTGTWAGTAALSNSVTINTAGTVTITNVIYTAGTITYTAGTVSHTGKLTLNGSCTLNTAGMSWNNIQPTDFGALTLTITLTSAISVAGVLTTATNGNLITFSGAFGMTLGTLAIGRQCSVTYPAGQTITVTTALIIVGQGDGDANATSGILKSDTASSSIFLNFTGPITGNKCFFASFTDVDASGSAQPILNYFGGNPGGTLTRTTNIVNQNLPITTTSARIGL